MKKITFEYSHNVFLDNGIVGVYKFLREWEHKPLKTDLLHLKVEEGIHFHLLENTLEIEHEYLFDLLEEIYYFMGKSVYDTASKKQLENGGENIYFQKSGELGGRFPKMNTYGFTELLTNNAQGVARDEKNSLKIADIEKNDPVLADKIKQIYTDSNVKMLSKIFFEEGYTKITRLEKPIKAFFEDGTNVCYLTGKPFKKLVDAQNISPFLSGLTYFDSFMSNSNRKISWTALYLSRFTAGMCLYSYPNKLRESLNIYFLHSNSLKSLNKIHSQRFVSGIMKLDEALCDNDFVANFPRNESTSLGRAFDYINTYENLIYMLHHIYINMLKNFPDKNFFEALEEEEMEWNPISIIAIRAESFAATMRPVQFEVITHFYSMMKFFSDLEKEQIRISDVLSSLKILKPSKNSPSNEKRFDQERQQREQILKLIFNGKSITDEIESFFMDCYGFGLDVMNEPMKSIGFKHYNQVFAFYNYYEKQINQSNMDDLTNLRSSALSLGARIGQGILNFSTSDAGTDEIKNTLKKDNAKRSRKYIIRLRKANHFDEFLAQISDLQGRYTLGIERDFLENISQKDFSVVKQFIIISILNQINPVISNSKKKEKDETK